MALKHGLSGKDRPNDPDKRAGTRACRPVRSKA